MSKKLLKALLVCEVNISLRNETYYIKNYHNIYKRHYGN